jgi:hypothetical protein
MAKLYAYYYALRNYKTFKNDMRFLEVLHLINNGIDEYEKK